MENTDIITAVVAGVIVVAYVLSPVDIIPDFLPGGAMDDTLIGAAAVYLFAPR